MLHYLKQLVPALALAMTLTACGPVSDPASTLTETRANLINRHLESFVQDFIREYGKPIPALPISIGPLKAGTLGVCHKPGKKPTHEQVADTIVGGSTESSRYIVISDAHYLKHIDTDPQAIQQVVFHELGHCILDRDHLQTMTTGDDGEEIPLSIMLKTGFGDRPYYQRYFDRYVNELFGRNAALKAPEGGDSGTCVVYGDDEA